MFFKRFGVLKTRDMNNKIKILDQLPFDKNSNEGKSLEKLKELLSSNQTYTEILKRIEDVSKDALGKLFVSDNKSEMALLTSDSCKLEKPMGDRDTFLRTLLPTGYGKSAEAIVGAVLNYKSFTVFYALKKDRNDIQKLYNAAKTKKRGMKDSQKKIYDNLEKYVKLYQKAKVLHDKIKSSTPYLVADNDTKKKLEKLTEQFNNLCGDIIEIRGKVEELLKKTGNKEKDCGEAVICIAYPKVIVDYDGKFKMNGESVKNYCMEVDHVSKDFDGHKFEGSEYYIDRFIKEALQHYTNFNDFILMSTQKYSGFINLMNKYNKKFTIDGKSVHQYYQELVNEFNRNLE